jgi:putative oxidoreductase
MAVGPDNDEVDAMLSAATLVILGRILLGGLFVIAGVRHFFLLDALTPVMANRGVPLAKWALVAGSLFQIVAGAMLMAGIAVTYAAIGLVAFTLAASFLFLNYWDMQGAERENAKSFLLSNMAILGGLLMAAAQGL